MGERENKHYGERECPKLYLKIPKSEKETKENLTQRKKGGRWQLLKDRREDWPKFSLKVVPEYERIYEIG